MTKQILKLYDVSQDDLVQQGDIFKNVHYIYDVKRIEDTFHIVELTFPYILIVSQSCDVLHASRLIKNEISSEAKMMFSVLAVPFFERQTIITGQHLKELKDKKVVDLSINTEFISKHDQKVLDEGMHYRFHPLIVEARSRLPESIIDFKSFFTLNVSQINGLRDQRIGRIGSIECQQIVNKFSAFLSRVGLPDEVLIKTEK